jgi:D-alanyl-D-alanine carboxypeptidase
MEGGATSFIVQLRCPGGEWPKAYGVRNLDSKDPAQPQDRVSIASITMSMVAVSVLKLVDQGLIGLDDLVNGILDSFRTTLRPPGPITVRQLLNHTSGMPHFVDSDSDYAAGSLKQAAATQLSIGLRSSTSYTARTHPKQPEAHSSRGNQSLGQVKVSIKPSAVPHVELRSKRRGLMYVSWHWSRLPGC